jgi:hypothetical protein
MTFTKVTSLATTTLPNPVTFDFDRSPNVTVASFVLVLNFVMISLLPVICFVHPLSSTHFDPPEA